MRFLPYWTMGKFVEFILGVGLLVRLLLGSFPMGNLVGSSLGLEDLGCSFRFLIGVSDLVGY